jgi:DNA-binding FadR family transcriptional regulator
VAALRARDPEAARTAIAAHYRYAEERLFPGLG